MQGYCSGNLIYTNACFTGANLLFSFFASMEKVLITGGTGMLGTALRQRLVEKGYEVIILTRKKRSPGNQTSYAAWDAEKGFIEENAISEADHIVHLAGANLAEGRWTEKRKKIFRDSRVKTGELLVHALATIPNKVRTVVSASAIGYYGPDASNPRPFVEDDNPDNDFLGTLVQQWEGAIKPVQQQDKRLVIFRFGILLSTSGGAYEAFKKPLKFGVSAVLGNGKQIVSWLHIDDATGMILEAITNPSLNGVYNAVAPQPVSNKQLMQSIARHISPRHIQLAVPAVFLKIGLGEMSIEVLKSATVSAEKIKQAGYVFQYPDIDSAIRKLAAS